MSHDVYYPIMLYRELIKAGQIPYDLQYMSGPTYVPRSHFRQHPCTVENKGPRKSRYSIELHTLGNRNVAHS
jgi:hypothetical protein